MKRLPSRRERELARGPLQQARRHPRFQRLNAAAHGVGRHAVSPGSFGKAAAADHFDEQRHIVQVKHALFLRCVDQ